jgi:hypothetical protein
MSLPDRFWAKVNRDGPAPIHRPELGSCWLWIAGSSQNGYGLFWWDGSMKYAHRVAFEQLVGSVPAGLDLDHLCRVRDCVRPAHLEPVTRRENLVRGNGFIARQARQTTCRRGHDFDTVDTLGRRVCRTCANENRRRRHERSGR